MPSTIDLMQTEAESKEADIDGKWVSRCRSIEKWIALAFAVALSLPITIPWIVLIAGLIVWLAKNRVSPVQLKDDFGKTPLGLPIAVFALVAVVSCLVNGGFRDLGPVCST